MLCVRVFVRVRARACAARLQRVEAIEELPAGGTTSTVFTVDRWLCRSMVQPAVACGVPCGARRPLR
jgi:hypothetical protein